MVCSSALSHARGVVEGVLPSYPTISGGVFSIYTYWAMAGNPHEDISGAGHAYPRIAGIAVRIVEYMWGQIKPPRAFIFESTSSP